MEAASGIARIAEFKMADIIRKTTVEKGFDPRDFVLFAFGGAGPAHAGVFARELGVQKVIVPQKEIASTWCAFGAASADILHVHEQVDIQASPFDAARANASLEALEKRASEQMDRDGIAGPRRDYQFSLAMGHKGRINEVEVMLPEKRVKESLWQALHKRFYARYEQLYGSGSSYGEARLEIVTLRLRATAATPRPKLSSAKKLSAKIESKARCGQRSIYWADLKKPAATPILDGAFLVPGNTVRGPAVIETTDTTVVVHPGRTRSEEHTSELQSQSNLVCRLLLEKKKTNQLTTPRRPPSNANTSRSSSLTSRRLTSGPVMKHITQRWLHT